ncbi:MAG TPA: MFS transporter [Actinomycetota bacterium]|nr:MFS transporter [Actinomycetota bacterium]
MRRSSDRPPPKSTAGGSSRTGSSSKRSPGLAHRALDKAAEGVLWLIHMAERATRPIQRMWASDHPLDRYTLVHMASVAGDALVAIALADSVFFSIPVGQAKVKVALYLALTMAPLALAAPLMVPLLDRGGFRRAITFGAGVGRAVVALIAAPNFDTVLLFPTAFILLALSRVHAITKNGLTTAYAEHGEALVQANARMNRVAIISGGVAAVPGVIAAKLGGAPAVLVLAAVAYVGTALLVLRLPRLKDETPPAVIAEAGDDSVGKRGNIPALALPALATAGLRAANGFLVFLVAFALRSKALDNGHPASKATFGLVLAAGFAGTFVGDLVAPRLSKLKRDGAVVLASLFVAGAAALLAFVEYSALLLAVFGLLAGMSTEFGRLAFQSLMQQHAPADAQGRVFVRYEVVFQLAWVFGAFFPAVLAIGFRSGTFILAAFYLALGAAFVVWARLPSHRAQASDDLEAIQ